MLPSILYLWLWWLDILGKYVIAAKLIFIPVFSYVAGYIKIVFAESPHSDLQYFKLSFSVGRFQCFHGNYWSFVYEHIGFNSQFLEAIWKYPLPDLIGMCTQVATDILSGHLQPTHWFECINNTYESNYTVRYYFQTQTNNRYYCNLLIAKANGLILVMIYERSMTNWAYCRIFAKRMHIINVNVATVKHFYNTQLLMMTYSEYIVIVVFGILSIDSCKLVHFLGI